MSTVQGYQGVPYSKADEHLFLKKKKKPGEGARENSIS